MSSYQDLSPNPLRDPKPFGFCVLALDLWTEGSVDQLKKGQIYIRRIHAIRSLKIRTASCRSRAAPPRNASNSARNS